MEAGSHTLGPLLVLIKLNPLAHSFSFPFFLLSGGSRLFLETPSLLIQIFQLWVKAGSNANSLPPAGSLLMFFSTVHISPSLPSAGTVRSVPPHFHQLILIFSPKGNQPQVGWSQQLEIFRLDISWRWSCACLRWRSYPHPHAAQCYPRYPPKTCLVVSRR
jgi:hypothetical protein